MLLKMQVFWDVKVSLSKWLSTFRKSVVPSYSRVKRSKAGEKCGNTYVRAHILVPVGGRSGRVSPALVVPVGLRGS